MKVTDLKRKAEILDKLKKLPKTIKHDRLGISGESLDWIPEERDWRLVLEYSEQEKYRLAYILFGWDGEEQALPFTEEQLDLQKETGTIMFTGGIYEDDIEILIEKMENWIKSQSAGRK